MAIESFSSSVLGASFLSPKEKLLERPTKGGKLFIGLPKELSFEDNRIALTPESVALLTANGHRIVIESKAGAAAQFTDHDYSEAGAEITYQPEKVFQADIILKVAPPTLDQIDCMKPGQTVFSPLHLPTLKSETIAALMRKKVTAISYEYIQDESGSYPMVRTLSEIAGSTSILIAAEYLSSGNNGQGVLLGGVAGVPPSKVVILGAGVVGEFATKAALGLGAEVRVFDNNSYKLMRLQNNVHSRIWTSVISPDVLQAELALADVAVGAIHSELGRTPVVVTEEMVAGMKPGAVIVDVSIDQGGCFETSRVTTHTKPTFTEYDVIHYCVPNIASKVAKTASYALSHVITPILLEAHRNGGFEKLLYSSVGTRHGVYIFKGALTNRHLSERFDLHYTDLNLLIASSM